jgi:hypothetical protein
MLGGRRRTTLVIDRLGTLGMLALLVFVAALLAAFFTAKATVPIIAAAVSGIFVLTRVFRAGDA